MGGLIETMDTVNAAVKAAWDDDTLGAEAIIGYAPELEYEGVPSADNAALDKVYGRVTTKEALGHQATLTNGDTTRDFNSVGSVIVQIFAPKANANLIRKCKELAEYIRNAVFRGRSNEVWYRDATIKTIGPGKRWYQLNVVAEYNSEETKG